MDQSVNWISSTMILYISLIIICTLIGVIIDYCKELCNKKVLFIPFFVIFLVLVFFSGFRLVGEDFDAYKTVFEVINNKDELDFFAPNMEIGYLFLNQIVRIVTDEFLYFVIVTSIIINTLIIYTIYHFREKIYVSIALFSYVGLYYFQSYNLIRYYLAVSIVIFSLVFLVKRKYLIMYLLLILSATIHRSVYIYIIMSFLYFFHNKKILASIGLLIGVLLLYFRIELIFSILNLQRYSYYFDNVNEANIGIGNLVIFFPYIALFIYTLGKTKDNFMNYAYLYPIIGFALSILGYRISIFGRLSVLYSAQYIIFFPYLIRNSSSKYHDKIIITTLSIIYICFLIVNYFERSLFSDGINIYRNIFFSLR